MPCVYKISVDLPLTAVFNLLAYPAPDSSASVFYTHSVWKPLIIFLDPSGRTLYDEGAYTPQS